MLISKNRRTIGEINYPTNKIQTKIREIQIKIKIIFLTNPKNKKTADSSMIFVLISLFLSLDFLDSFENPGNQNKKSVFFIVWITPFLFRFP
jgi:hypothetical protein